MTPRRRVQYVVICEDQQHEVFVRRFLKAMGLIASIHQLRVEPSPRGRGAAERFVREQYVDELKAVRSTHVATTLLVVVDGDAAGVNERLRQLDEACSRQGVPTRSPEDSVAVFVPTWNIETWLAYLDGETVDESRKDYRRLARPGDCQPHVGVLAEMCRHRSLRLPAPQSLQAACREYEEHLR